MIAFADNPVAGWEFFCVLVGALMSAGGYVGYRVWKGELGGKHDGGY